MRVINDERTDTLYPVGDLPPIGTVPKYMHAWTVREDRFGEPLTAFREEIVEVPKPRRGELIVLNMAAGINYNGIWVGLGQPKNVIEDHGKWGERKEDFFICGSEAAGIVYEVGEGVKDFKVGDEVYILCAQADYESCPIVQAGKDPMTSPSFRVWGYESNWGSFAQFSRVQQQQCFIKPKALSWEEAACSLGTGLTVLRMLTNYQEHAVKPGDIVLIWGGYGGLGSMAIQIVKHYGGIPIAVISDDARAELCMQLGAKGCINRQKYKHFGALEQDYKDPHVYKAWLKDALRMRREIYNIVGKKANPDIVIEHPGESTLPTSMFLCARGGMVVTCGATTGYIGSLDLRFLWLHQKRLQGSHIGRREEVPVLMDLIGQGALRPVISKILDWKQLAEGHQLLYDNKHPGGNMALLIGARR
ncbi:crotonyl-CoA reductase [Paenibacillus dendritiformis]|uniref:crotonyl-CoA carboxylase/reductase n=1 Tax=Paenibacillus dendritiformis TaxID=130049 RepID=UPI0018CCDBF9|nr:crotonyl-CoA carboxylase/reductase [Paenibacillus dendritiformis]MBG9792897.1 crotonyl-CoA reductase [Paenibacillus dendritiformis]